MIFRPYLWNPISLRYPILPYYLPYRWFPSRGGRGGWNRGWRRVFLPGFFYPPAYINRFYLAGPYLIF